MLVLAVARLHTSPHGGVELPDAALVGSMLWFLPLHIMLAGARPGPYYYPLKTTGGSGHMTSRHVLYSTCCLLAGKTYLIFLWVARLFVHAGTQSLRGAKLCLRNSSKVRRFAARQYSLAPSPPFPARTLCTALPSL